jgi:ferredoxin
MTKVRFLPSRYECDVTPTRRMVDVTDEHPGSAVPYSCRSASCGTCRVRVKQGMEAFAAPEDEELSVLDIFGDGPDTRLCCQLKLTTDVPLVVLEVVEP